MKIIHAIPVLPFVLILFISSLPKSFAQSGVVLYPSKGTVFTNITMEAYVPINSRNNIFWDDAVIALDVNHGQENYPLIMNITCPNRHPYSDLGNHTITVETFYWDGSDKVAYLNTTFEIIEYFPCDEWLALNATYTSLLNDYNALNASYQDLMAQYNTLSANYDALLNQYSTLLGNYNSLLGSYSSLSSDFDEMNRTYYLLRDNYQNLSSTHSQLESSYNGLTTSYNSLQSVHNSLTSNYAQLQGNYTQLVSSYNGLQTDYTNLVADLTNYRNLTYIFIATTVVFLATTIYFATRKTKAIQSTR